MSLVREVQIDNRPLASLDDKANADFSNSLRSSNDLSDVLFLSEQNATVDRLCDLPAQILTSDVVSAEVLPCVNTAQSRFLRRCGEACEVSRHSRQRLGADIESELVAEVKAQHGRARFADCAVCSWVGRIWSGPRG